MDAPTLLRRAKLNDIEVVVMVLDEAATWLADRGIIQWPSHFDADWLRPAVRAGETWPVDVDSRPAATITLSWTDPIWPDVRCAGHVHRLAVRRSASGLGARLLDWAQAEAQRRGRPLLRLDCVGTARPARSANTSQPI